MPRIKKRGVSHNVKVPVRRISQNRIKNLSYSLQGRYAERDILLSRISNLKEELSGFPEPKNALEAASKSDLEIKLIEAENKHTHYAEKIALDEGKLSDWLNRNKTIAATRGR